MKRVRGGRDAVRKVDGDETGAMHIYTVVGTMGIQNEVSRQT